MLANQGMNQHLFITRRKYEWIQVNDIRRVFVDLFKTFGKCSWAKLLKKLKQSGILDNFNLGH